MFDWLLELWLKPQGQWTLQDHISFDGFLLFWSLLIAAVCAYVKYYMEK